jgi:hypothetical protein
VYYRSDGATGRIYPDAYPDWIKSVKKAQFCR